MQQLVRKDEKMICQFLSFFVKLKGRPWTSIKCTYHWHDACTGLTLGLGRGPFRVVHALAVLTGPSPKMCRVPFYGHLVRVVRQENACTTTLNSGPNPSGHHLEEQSPPQKLKNCIFLEELSPANCISLPNCKSKSHPTKKTELTRHGPHKHKMHFFFYFLNISGSLWPPHCLFSLTSNWKTQNQRPFSHLLVTAHL